MAEGVGFEPTWELLAPKSISSRPRYGLFGTPPLKQTAVSKGRVDTAHRKHLHFRASLPKKLLHQLPALGFPDAAGHLQAVVEPRVLGNPVQGDAGPGL